MYINLINPSNKTIKKVKVGFSWTTLFLGVLVPLFRGDTRGFFRMFIVSGFTAGIGFFVFPFTYNKSYIKFLIEEGYIPESDDDRAYLACIGIIFEE